MPITSRRRVAAAALLLPFALAACSSSPSNNNSTLPATAPAKPAAAAPAPTTPAAQPATVDGARAVAEQLATLFSAGDWAGSWDLWTAASKKAFSRDDYVKLHQACPGAVGIPMTVKSIRLENPQTAVFIIERATFTFSYQLNDEAGQWRFQPPATDMADYAKGVDKVIASRKAEGSC